MTTRKISFYILLLFLFSIPWEDSYTLGSLGSISRLIGLAAIGFWLFSLLMTRQIRKFHPMYLFIFLYILWNIVSLLWTVDVDMSSTRINTFVQMGLLSWLIWDQIEDVKQLRAMLQAYILGSLISIGGTIINFIQGHEAFLYSGGRYAANGFNADDLAIIIVLGLPMAWYLLIESNQKVKTKWLAVVNIGYLPLAIFAIILTGSRAGFICLLISIVYFILSLRKVAFTWRIAILFLISVSFFLFLQIIPSTTTARLLGTFQSLGAGDWGGRQSIFGDATQILNTHPLLGVGSGAFKAASQFGTLAHNTFLSILAETGSIGFLLFFLILLAALYEIFQQPKPERNFWLATLIVWAIGSSSVSWEFRKPTWIILNLIVISATIYRASVFSPKNNVANREPEKGLELNPNKSGVIQPSAFYESDK